MIKIPFDRWIRLDLEMGSNKLLRTRNQLQKKETKKAYSEVYKTYI